MIRLLVKFLRPYLWLLVAVVGLQLVQSVASLFLPTLNARIIDQGVAAGNTAVIWQFGLVMLGVSLVQIGAQAAATWFGARSSMAFGRDLRSAVFSSIVGFSSREVGDFGAPSLITRNTNDVQQVQQLVLMTGSTIVAAPLTMIGGVFMALREDVGLSWLILVAVVLIGILVGLLVARVTPLFTSMQVRIDTVNRVLREQLSGLRVVRAFSREPVEAARFDVANTELTDTATRVGQQMNALFPAVVLVMNLSSVAVIWFGAFRIASGDLQVGQLTAYLAYLTQILTSVMMSTIILMLGPRAAVSGRRIAEVLDTTPSVVVSQRPVTSLSRRPRVGLEEAGFTYPGADHPVLAGITFEVRPGTTTAIIGSTGAGKTTLVSLIPRLFDATSGVVSVDGVDVRDLALDALRNRIGFVPQRPYLFTGTVASNLRLANPQATDAELWHALEVAQAREFVERLSDGLDSAISQGGTNVSGGQRQRLAIARALVRRPAIYIFDDSFSALDGVTEAALRTALAVEAEDAALLVVAQRVSTIRDADQIIVLDAGRIVGMGTHDHLFDTCPTYVQIVDSQAQTEGVAA